MVRTLLTFKSVTSAVATEPPDVAPAVLLVSTHCFKHSTIQYVTTVAALREREELHVIEKLTVAQLLITLPMLDQTQGLITVQTNYINKYCRPSHERTAYVRFRKMRAKSVCSEVLFQVSICEICRCTDSDLYPQVSFIYIHCYVNYICVLCERFSATHTAPYYCFGDILGSVYIQYGSAGQWASSEHPLPILACS